MKRASGILLHITSLPSPYGVGTLGKAAFDFVDYLHRARQRYWQILPLTPTGFGDSPYQSASTFAGNPYLVDLDLLKEKGLLTDEDIGEDWGEDPRKVDFGLLYVRRRQVLEKAFARFDRAEMAEYVARNAWYLEDWTLFCALKDHFEGKCWIDWPEDIRNREPEAVARYRELLREQIDYHAFVQYCFDSQWQALRAYAHEQGVSFIGDIPIYVPYDSVDVWAHRELFQLTEAGIPKLIAGVPPDYFSETGQLWGNPVYDWDANEKENFAWWRSRLKGAASRCDIIRIDHFRGLESFWGVQYGAADARVGQWYPGPGMKLIRAFREEGMGESIIAEDLGFLTPEVKKLLNDSGCPGMRVMQFGFEPMGDSRELPHNYVKNCVAYLGTHDNDTIMGWFNATAPSCAAFAVDYLGLNQQEGFPFGFIRGLMTSVADLVVIQMQDVLGLGSEHRMNLPATTGWWGWRALPEEFDPATADRLAYYTRMSGRAPVPKKR